MCDQQSLISACAYAQSDQSLCWSLEYSMIVKLLTEHHLEFLCLKAGCRGSFDSTLVKMSNCWKSHAAARLYCSSTGEPPEVTQYKCLCLVGSIIDLFIPDDRKLLFWLSLLGAIFRPNSIFRHVSIYSHFL